MRGADVVVKMLEAHGVTHIFGVPGDTSMAFHDALRIEAGSITHILCRDERHAAYAADAYSRVTGKMGVVEVPSGGGALYAIPGISEANLSNIPLLCIASEISMNSDEMNALTDCNQVDLFASASKWNAKVQLSGKIPQLMRKAIRMSSTGVPGAVALSLPENLLREEYTGGGEELYALKGAGTWGQIRGDANEMDVSQVYSLLENAKRPIVLAGGGVHLSGAYDELETFSSAFWVPVVTSVDGKGSISELAKSCLGVVGANGGSSQANQVMLEADLIIVLGCKADNVTTVSKRIIAKDAVIVQVDISDAVLGNVLDLDYPILCDIKGFLQKLNSRNHQPDVFAERFREWMEFARKKQEEKMNEIACNYTKEAANVVSARVFGSLEDLTGENTIFCGDAGTPTPYISSYIRQKKAGKYSILPRAHGALGYAIGASIGAQVGRPDCKVISMFGDSSFGMAMGELETAKRLQLPIVFINFQNDCYGWIKTIQKLYYKEKYFGVDFCKIDGVKVAEGFGIKGRNVSRNQDIKEAVAWALDLNEPVFLNFVVEPPTNYVPPVYQWEKDIQVLPQEREKLVY